MLWKCRSNYDPKLSLHEFALHVVYGSGCWCITEVDECGNRPCKNGGQCLDDLGFPQCVCQPGFQGALCDEGKKVEYHSPKI